MASSEAALAQSPMVIGTAGQSYRRSSRLFLLMGIIQLALGGLIVASSGVENFGGLILLILGISFVVYGIGAARAARQYQQFATERQAPMES